MFIEDIQGCDNVVLDDMDEDIVMAHVGVIMFHIIAVLLCESLVTFNTGTECFKAFLQS